MLAGVTEIEVCVTTETVTVLEPDLPPHAAVMTASPEEMTVTTPVLAVTVAINMALDVHAAAVLMSTTAPSE